MLDEDDSQAFSELRVWLQLRNGLIHHAKVVRLKTGEAFQIPLNIRTFSKATQWILRCPYFWITYLFWKENHHAIFFFGHFCWNHEDTDPPPQSWPSRGSIEFQNVFLRYRPELPTVLNGLTLKIEGREKMLRLWLGFAMGGEFFKNNLVGLFDDWGYGWLFFLECFWKFSMCFFWAFLLGCSWFIWWHLWSCLS